MSKYDAITSEFGSDEEEAAYDKWFRAMVAKAMACDKPGIPHDQVMARARGTLERARNRRAEACESD